MQHPMTGLAAVAEETKADHTTITGVHHSVGYCVARLHLQWMCTAARCCLAAAGMPGHTALHHTRIVMCCNITHPEESAGC